MRRPTGARHYPQAVRQLRDEGLARTAPGWGTYAVKKNDNTGSSDFRRA